ncbi:hypothetical protein GH733_000920 [Mirounga leonina]|nr:hypothetical protein GH733_000920 [Mirounga leonina]
MSVLNKPKSEVTGGAAEARTTPKCSLTATTARSSWPCESLRQALQHGVGECEGYVDQGPQECQGKESKPVNKDSYISKMFLNGDSVIAAL